MKVLRTNLDSIGRVTATFGGIGFIGVNLVTTATLVVLKCVNLGQQSAKTLGCA
jgi:hypothetical protein